jgi:chromosome segregation ATPase
MFTLSLERVDAESLTFYQHNDLTEVHRLSRRVSELVFQRHEADTNSLQQLGLMQQVMQDAQQALSESVAERAEDAKKRDAAEAELCTLTASHDELSRRLSASSAALASSEAAARTIEQERDSFSARLSESQQQLNDARQQMADAAALHAELKVQVEKFTKQVMASEACAEQQRRRCASLEDSIGRLQQEMKTSQQALADCVADRANDAKRRDALEAEIADLIQLRLIESRSARLDSEATARSYKHHCDVLDTSLSDLQQQLNDARQQMADAAAGSDALHAELRGQIEQLHHELEASEACTEQHRRRCASLEDSLKQLQQAMKSGENKL